MRQPAPISGTHDFDFLVGSWAVQHRRLKQRLANSSEWETFASLPVLALMVSLIGIVLTPAINGLSRYREHEAGRCGLELVHGIVANAGETAALALQKDAESALSDPNPPVFVRSWYFDHPPVNERIAFFRTYDPWSDGGQPRYVK